MSVYVRETNEGERHHPRFFLPNSNGVSKVQPVFFPARRKVGKKLSKIGRCDEGNNVWE